MSSLERKQLAETITAHAFALQKIEQAEATLQKAKNLHCSLRADLADLATLDTDIVAARASSLATALANDEAPMFEEPGGFSVAIVKKQKIESELAITASSIVVLESELAVARQNADDLSIAIEHAVEAVTSKEAEKMAQSFMRRLEQLRKEQYVLAAMMNRWIPRARAENVVDANGVAIRGVRQVRIPAVVHVALAQPILGDSELRGGILVRNSATLAAAAYWRSLKDNPEAQFGADDSSNDDHSLSSESESDASLESAE